MQSATSTQEKSAAGALAAQALRQELAPELRAPALGDRSWFPRLEYDAALAHAAISPASLLVERAVARATAELGQHASRAFPIYEAQRERLRQKLSALL